VLSLNDILVGGLFPALVACAVLALARLIPGRGNWAGPIAVALAFAVAFPAVAGRVPRSFANGTAEERLLFLAIPVAILAAVAALPRVPRWLGSLTAVATIAMVLWLVLARAAESWTPGGYYGMLAHTTAAMALAWFCLNAVARSPSRVTAFIAMAGINLGASLLLMLSGVQSYGQYAGGVLAAILAVLLLLVLGLCPHTLAGLPLVFVVIVGTLLTAGTDPLFGYAKVYNAALIATAPLILWLSQWLRWRSARAWQVSLLRLALTAVPVLIALAVAGKQFRDAMASDGAGYY